VANLVKFYLGNAAMIRSGLTKLGYSVFGGTSAPYVWIQTPGRAPSWEFFDRLLQTCHVVCTPGSGFGKSGEGYIRLSAFNSRSNVEEALERMRKL
jgi:LL-diaminopimelate aminotransferase